MDPQDASSALGQYLEIAARLGGLHDAEGVFLPWNMQIAGVIAGDLQEHPGVGTAFVGLPGRMEEARPEAHTGRDQLSIAYHQANILQCIGMELVAFDVGKEPTVVTGPQQTEVCLETSGKCSDALECVSI